ncbi:MAG: Gldg family protein [Luteolibacter sp.]
MKTTHPVTRSALGIAALVVIAILANWLVSLTPLGNRGVDFTEHKIHTLSKGTRAILSELDTPVVIRYYATRGSSYMPEEIKLHMRRVDDLLAEYASLSNGMLRIEHLDPQPDTEAEDSAQLDGMSGQRIHNENVYFGLAVSCLDKTTVIPFLDPRDETMLEYHLSSSIYEVSAPVKPVIGILSGIELAGMPMMMPGQAPNEGWVIYHQLKQTYEIRDIPMEGATEIDPNEIKLLIVFHPAGISPETEYAIDQYLLRGGTVVACLDAYSVAAQMLGGGNPMMGMGGAPTSSTLPTLLDAWGVTFESGQVLADASLATRLSGDRDGIAVLTLPQENMPRKDSVITQNLGSVTMFLPGAFTRTGGAGVDSDALVISSTRAGFVDAMRATQLDPLLNTELRPRGTAFDLVTHLSGKFRSAFPDGPPNAAGEDDQEETENQNHLAEAAEAGNVFLIADIDMFHDNFAYNVQNFGGLRMVSPINGNSTLMFNLIDQAVGSRHLIGSRSRSALRRPFTVIADMEAEFNKQVGTKIEEFQTRQREAQERLNELQAQKAQGTELFLSPEQEAEIQKLREEQVKYNRLIREQEIELRRQKDHLAGRVTKLNVGVMPSIVILIGFWLYLNRRNATRAR